MWTVVDRLLATRFRCGDSIQMEIAVRDVLQTASGGSYFVKFRAVFDLTDTPGVDLAVSSYYPDDVSPEYVTEASNAIRDAFEGVLANRGQGAHVVIHDLGIHEVDFKIRKFKQATERFLLDYLAGQL